MLQSFSDQKSLNSKKKDLHIRLSDLHIMSPLDFSRGIIQLTHVFIILGLSKERFMFIIRKENCLLFPEFSLIQWTKR